MLTFILPKQSCKWRRFYDMLHLYGKAELMMKSERNAIAVRHSYVEYFSLCIFLALQGYYINNPSSMLQFIAPTLLLLL